MKKVIISLLILSQVLFALNATYHGEKYILCSSERYLDDWVGFVNDGDKASMRSYFGNQCIMLKNPIQVSSVDSHIFKGTVSFFYKGYKFWGHLEGIER